MATAKKKKPVKPKGNCGCKHSKGKKNSKQLVKIIVLRNSAMDGGLTFGGYSSGKYLNDASGKLRMAGDIFQDTFGDEGWNEEFLNTNGEPLNVDREPALDYVAGKAAEK